MNFIKGFDYIGSLFSTHLLIRGILMSEHEIDRPQDEVSGPEESKEEVAEAV